MMNRYEAVLDVWSPIQGMWFSNRIGTFKTAERAAIRLYKVRRRYTRYPRHCDFGYVYDRKLGRSVNNWHDRYNEHTGIINASFDLPTVGDLGYTP